ncbi:MAG: tryptophan 7-halogenase [Henriciella sp.]
MRTERFDIVVCGDGFAAAMTAMGLLRALPSNYAIHRVRSGNSTKADILYGSVTAPSAYDFLRKLGLDEPALFTRSGTSFCYGTWYQNWLGGRSWMQGYAQPFQNIAGVPLVHHLTRAELPLEPVLVSAQAALKGRFAHPPEDPNVPLSRAEYGYQFSVAEWTRLLEAEIAKSSITTFGTPLARIDFDDFGHGAVRLESGEVLKTDLIVDCTGPERRALSEFGGKFVENRSIFSSSTRAAATELGWPHRIVEADPYGWTSKTHLQQAIDTVRVQSMDAPRDMPGIEFALGSVDVAWIGNCVAIGQAACALEPLTPAPMILLQRDIERLLELIPLSDDSNAERREFNRRFKDDVDHAALFQGAFYCAEQEPRSDFWSLAATSAQSPKLKRKVAQFENRGVLVRFDLEPFNDEDWTILHFGLGRRPRHYDLQAQQLSEAQARTELARMRQAIEQMVPRMPPHHLYVANMKKYFEKRNYA